MVNQAQDYDLAFSFAGEQRSYVEATKEECEKLGLRVFYDRDLNNQWWGHNFISEQRKVYGLKARYFVPFISDEYFKKPIPSDEFEVAMWTNLERGGDYILPVKVGDTSIPQDKLHPHTHYLQSDKYTPVQLAYEFSIKVKGGQQPKEVAEVVSAALNVRLPKITPISFSKYDELDVALSYLETKFKETLPELSKTGCVGTIRNRNDRIVVRVERTGETIYALDIYQGGLSDDSIAFSLNNDHGYSSNSFNAAATPFFDVEAGVPKLKMLNMDFISAGSKTDPIVTKEELFDAIWDKMIDQIEARSNR